MTDYADRLYQYDSTWEEIPVREPMQKLPPGTYQGQVVVSRVEEADNEYKTLQYVLTFQVVSGEYEGTMHSKWTNLEREEGHKFLKQDLHVLGLDLPRLSDLPTICGDALGLIVEFKVVQKPGMDRDGNERTYTNTWINKVLDVGGPTSNVIEPPDVNESPPADTAPPDDDPYPDVPPADPDEHPW